MERRGKKEGGERSQDIINKTYTDLHLTKQKSNQTYTDRIANYGRLYVIIERYNNYSTTVEQT